MTGDKIGEAETDLKMIILKGKDKAKFEQIQKDLWELRIKENSLLKELDAMGLEFDLMGKPENFKIG